MRRVRDGAAVAHEAGVAAAGRREGHDSHVRVHCCLHQHHCQQHHLQESNERPHSTIATRTYIQYNVINYSQ